MLVGVDTIQTTANLGCLFGTMCTRCRLRTMLVSCDLLLLAQGLSLFSRVILEELRYLSEPKVSIISALTSKSLCLIGALRVPLTGLAFCDAIRTLGQ